MSECNETRLLRENRIACTGCDPFRCDLDCPLQLWPDDPVPEVRIVDGGLSDDNAEY
jgi:hypothetical protein